MPCIIPGCPNQADNNFSVRLRKPDTNAFWSPNTEAFMCDHHAMQGVKITVVIEPTRTGNVETIVSGSLPAVPATRITPIDPRHAVE